MSILRLKKCAIIAVNTIMSIWLIRAILFFVKRVLDAFADEKIVGYDIIKGGCFYCTVETTDEI